MATGGGCPPAKRFIEHNRAYNGPARKAFESLDGAGQNALARDFEELFDHSNASGDETLVVPSHYLEVVAVRR